MCREEDRKMAETFEEKYEDVLQNIEFALVQTYRAHAGMTDWQALDALDALIRTYQAETRGGPASSPRLGGYAQEAYEGMRKMCEWRLGREHFVDEEGERVDTEMKPKTVDEIIACLKRVRRSVEKWQKRGGRRGYFDFVQEFFP